MSLAGRDLVLLETRWPECAAVMGAFVLDVTAGAFRLR